MLRTFDATKNFVLPPLAVRAWRRARAASLPGFPQSVEKGDLKERSGNQARRMKSKKRASAQKRSAHGKTAATL